MNTLLLALVPIGPGYLMTILYRVGHSRAAHARAWSRPRPLRIRVHGQHARPRPIPAHARTRKAAT